MRAVQGRLLSVAGGALAISVTSVELGRGTTLPWRGETVTLRAALIARVEERRLATGRTLFVAGTSVAALLLVQAGFNILGGGSSSPAAPPPPPR